MLLKDKIILVFYAGVKGCNIKKSNEMVCRINEQLKEFRDESSEIIVLPDFTKEVSHIETINPRVIKDEEYEELEKTINKFKQKVDEYVARKD